MFSVLEQFVSLHNTKKERKKKEKGKKSPALKEFKSYFDRINLRNFHVASQQSRKEGRLHKNA